jgi:hypothetical protein
MIEMVIDGRQARLSFISRPFSVSDAPLFWPLVGRCCFSGFRCISVIGFRLRVWDPHAFRLSCCVHGNFVL